MAQSIVTTISESSDDKAAVNASSADVSAAPTAQDNYTTYALVRRLIADHLRPHAGRLIIAAVLMAIVAATTAATAQLLDPAIKYLFLEKDARMLSLIPAAVFLVMVVKALASFGQNIVMNYVGQRIVADTQIRMFDHLMHADVAWLRENHSGKLIAHFLNDAVLMREAVSRAITGIAKDFLTLLFLIGVMFYQDIWLTFIAIFVLPAVAVFVRQLARRMRKSVTHGMEETGNLSTMLAEALEGVRVVRAYGQEHHEIGRVSHSINLRLEHIMRGVRARSAASPITEALTGIAIAAAIYYAGARAISGEMELNHFVAFLGAMMLAYQPLKSLATLSTALQEGLAAAARSFAVLDIAPKVKDEDTAEMRQISEGRIRFRDVSFSYGGGVPALRQIDFEIAPGETIALVGPSGAGKSTILNLIPRFYDVTEGAVEIDGHDVKQFTLQSLRAGMAVVTQEQFLFDDTIRANIAYGRQDAMDAEIERAARAADAHNFISQLRDGYDTIVGESGLKLSGGQRQRIAIARAMLKDAPILLLDEATSALDTESERLVQAALDKLLRGRTALVIAHRLSTVMNADRIHVMVDGRIVETGTHAQLLLQDGVYARLCRTQFDMGDQATDSAQRSAQPVTLH